jgi:hypothetical protein
MNIEGKMRLVETSLPGMPKKTKKEKIIAEYRRKMASFSHTDKLTVPSPSDEMVKKESPKQTFSYIPIASPTQQARSPSTLTLDPKEFLAIKKDLLWTLILTMIIIMGEIGLWKVSG